MNYTVVMTASASYVGAKIKNARNTTDGNSE